MPRPRRIEGYAIVSEDGMLANAAGIMPDQLKFEGDRQFFERGLDGVVVVVHGRHSHEQQPHSHLRRRLILTRQVPTIAADPSNEKALFWNPGGASFEQALTALGVRDGSVGVIGGTNVFGMSWTVMTFSICRGRPGCKCPMAGRSFPTCPRGLQRKCLQVMGSTPANGRCLIRQKVWQSLAGTVRQSSTD